MYSVISLKAWVSRNARIDGTVTPITGKGDLLSVNSVASTRESGGIDGVEFR